MGAAAAGIGMMSAVASYGAARKDAANQRASAAYEANRNETNARLKEIEKQDFLENAKDEVFYREQQVSSMLGSQKVALAAQGIDVEGELGHALEFDEREVARQDVQTMKNNTWRQALGLDIEISDLNNAAKMARITGASQAASTERKGMISMVGGLAQGASQLSSYSGSRYSRKRAIPKGTKTTSFNYRQGRSRGMA